MGKRTVTKTTTEEIYDRYDKEYGKILVDSQVIGCGGVRGEHERVFQPNESEQVLIQLYRNGDKNTFCRYLVDDGDDHTNRCIAGGEIENRKDLPRCIYIR